MRFVWQKKINAQWFSVKTEKIRAFSSQTVRGSIDLFTLDFDRAINKIQHERKSIHVNKFFWSITHTFNHYLWFGSSSANSIGIEKCKWFFLLLINRCFEFQTSCQLIFHIIFTFFAYREAQLTPIRTQIYQKIQIHQRQSPSSRVIQKTIEWNL